MSSGGRDLHRALGGVLPENLPVIELGGPRGLVLAAAGRHRARMRTPENAERLAEVRARHDLDLPDGGRLGSVRVRHEHARAACRTSEERDRKSSLDRLEPPVEGELSEDERVRGDRAGRLAARREDSERDGQVERRPLLPHVGGSEIHRDAFLWKGEAVVLDRGGHPLAALAHRRRRQPDDRERRQSAREIDLDRDSEPLYTEYSAGTDLSDHTPPPRTSTPAAGAAIPRRISAGAFSFSSRGA